MFAFFCPSTSCWREAPATGERSSPLSVVGISVPGCLRDPPRSVGGRDLRPQAHVASAPPPDRLRFPRGNYMPRFPIRARREGRRRRKSRTLRRILLHPKPRESESGRGRSDMGLGAEIPPRLRLAGAAPVNVCSRLPSRGKRRAARSVSSRKVRAHFFHVQNRVWVNEELTIAPVGGMMGHHPSH